MAKEMWMTASSLAGFPKASAPFSWSTHTIKSSKLSTLKTFVCRDAQKLDVENSDVRMGFFCLFVFFLGGGGGHVTVGLPYLGWPRSKTWLVLRQDNCHLYYKCVWTGTWRKVQQELKTGLLCWHRDNSGHLSAHCPWFIFFWLVWKTPMNVHI